MSWETILKIDGMTSKDIAFRFVDNLMANYIKKLELEEIQVDEFKRMAMETQGHIFVRLLEKQIKEMDDFIDSIATGEIPLTKMQEELQ
jgi:hypothetical protein